MTVGKALFDHDVLMTDTSLTVWWMLPDDAGRDRRFEVSLDDRVEVVTQKTHWTFNGLIPESRHNVTVRYDAQGKGHFRFLFSVDGNTRAARRRLDVSKPPYNAVGDGKTLNTEAIQRAFDDCDARSQVFIPAGIYLSGALRMHSDSELYIDKRGVLQGTSNPVDYEPPIWSRFEGVEGECYQSLINIGSLERGRGGDVREDGDGHRLAHGDYSCENVVIRGEGSILGGGAELMRATIDQGMTEIGQARLHDGQNDKEYGDLEAMASRLRGRLINVSRARNVEISGLTIGMSPSWNIHFVYSDHVSTFNCSIISKGVWNGDGWDPDSSTNSVLFDCAFETGDDMVAIKSGKNPEGNIIGLPTSHIRVFDCTSRFGWGIAVGSEMSGGVSDVEVWDCDVSHGAYGLEVKTTRKRGGYVRDVVMRACKASHILIHSVDYNDDGTAADCLPVFENMRFEDICIDDSFDKADTPFDGFLPENDIEVCGFEGCPARNIVFRNVVNCSDGQEARSAGGVNDLRVQVADVRNIDINGVRYAD